MKLLITVPWSERLGGAEMMLWRFLGNLDTSRTRVTVVFFHDGPFEREVAALPDVKTVLVRVGRLRQLTRSAHAVRELAAVMRRERPDTILNWAASAQIYGACAARLAGIDERVVWWQHAIPCGHRMERAATLLPARAVGCSSTAAAAAQEAMWPRRSTFVVHPGTDGEIVKPMPRQQLGIPAERFVVGIVGRLQPWKGQDRVLRALARLTQQGHNVHGLIVGGDAHGLSPDYEPQLRRLIDELSLQGRVTMTGHVADPLPFIRSMDVLVNASVAEPFGIVVIEGMSQSVPVVAVGDAGARDIIVDGVSGILVNRPDDVLLAEAVDRLLVDRARREQIARAGRMRMLAEFTAVSMAAKLECALRELCDTPLPADLAAAA